MWRAQLSQFKITTMLFSVCINIRTYEIILLRKVITMTQEREWSCVCNLPEYVGVCKDPEEQLYFSCPATKDCKLFFSHSSRLYWYRLLLRRFINRCFPQSNSLDSLKSRVTVSLAIHTSSSRPGTQTKHIFPNQELLQNNVIMTSSLTYDVT